jgi:hypothetical protein
MKVGLSRRGVTALKARQLPIGTSVAESVAMRLANATSQAVRHEFAQHIQKHSTALGKVPARANLRHLKRVADVMEPLARTAKVVFDWGSDKPTGLILIGDVETADETPQAIDVQSVATENQAD